jgi:hypothetical protein
VGGDVEPVVEDCHQTVKAWNTPTRNMIIEANKMSPPKRRRSVPGCSPGIRTTPAQPLTDPSYLKLFASSRSQAVTRARELGLLER